MTGSSDFKSGDLVFIKPGNEKYVRNEQIASRGVIQSKVDEDWYRVYITSGDCSRLVEFPSWMLVKPSEREE